MTILRRDGLREGRGQPFVFLARLFHRASRDQILKFFIRAQPQHFLASAGGVSGAQVFMHDIEKLLELERGAARKDCNQLLGDEVRNPAGERVFLQNGHKALTITCPRKNGSKFSRRTQQTQPDKAFEPFAEGRGNYGSGSGVSSGSGEGVTPGVVGVPAADAGVLSGPPPCTWR